MESNQFHHSEAAVYLVKWALPVLGVLTSQILALAPLRSILECRKNEVLGPLNPLPYPVLLGNSVGMIIYSAAPKSVPVFLSNVGAVILSFFYLLTAHRLCKCAHLRHRIELLTLSLAALWMITGFTAALQESHEAMVSIVGLVGNMVVMFLFASPLSCLPEVIRNHNSISIDPSIAYGQVRVTQHQ